MPRETIVSDPYLRRLRVGWDRMGNVQVGVDVEGAEVGESGLWADLDRKGCNDLIRVVRRARDSAFGRDE